jgi:hypothetical protein
LQALHEAMDTFGLWILANYLSVCTSNSSRRLTECCTGRLRCPRYPSSP